MASSIITIKKKTIEMVFNATFNNISVISWQSVNRWRKPEYPEKTTDLSQVMWRKPEYPKKTTNLPQVTDRRNAEDLEKTIDLPRVTDKLYRRKPEYPEKTTDLSQVTDIKETGVPGENHRPATSH